MLPAMKKILASILFLLLAGCQSTEVIVREQSGAAISDATIVGISLSVQGQTTTTNSKGEASIPHSSQPTKWIVAKKVGFKDSEQISVERSKPIIVTLEKLGR